MDHHQGRRAALDQQGQARQRRRRSDGQLEEPLPSAARRSERGEEGYSALGGAGIDPLKLKPSLPVPADFDTFWATQKKQLAAVPVNARHAGEAGDGRRSGV